MVGMVGIVVVVLGNETKSVFMVEESNRAEPSAIRLRTILSHDIFKTHSDLLAFRGNPTPIHSVYYWTNDKQS